MNWKTLLVIAAVIVVTCIGGAMCQSQASGPAQKAKAPMLYSQLVTPNMAWLTQYRDTPVEELTVVYNVSLLRQGYIQQQKVIQGLQQAVQALTERVAKLEQPPAIDEAETIVDEVGE